MKNFLSDWRHLLPAAGIMLLAGGGLFFLLRRKPRDPGAMERERRAYLNRVGRIVEGQILEIEDHRQSPADAAAARKHRAAAATSGIQKLIHYTYSISGVTYETAQDITGLDEKLHLNRVAAGQTASVKYDPSNPSNSILLADDWSGLH